MPFDLATLATSAWVIPAAVLGIFRATSKSEAEPNRPNPTRDSTVFPTNLGSKYPTVAFVAAPVTSPLPACSPIDATHGPSMGMDAVIKWPTSLAEAVRDSVVDAAVRACSRY